MIRFLTGASLCVASLAVSLPIWVLSVAAFVWAAAIVVHRHHKQEAKREALAKLPPQHKRYPHDLAA